MTQITITFSTQSPEAMESALSALSEIYGYNPDIVTPASPSNAEKVEPNPEMRIDFIKRKLLAEISAKIIAHNSEKAATAARQSALAQSAEAAKTFVAS